MEAGRYLFLEPFFGGSHREFAEGLVSASRHRIDLMTMSARFWRWRMGGAALHFVRRLPDLSPVNGLMISGLMNLAELKALSPASFPPVAVYFHENQLTYPVSEGRAREVALAWTNVTTALCADRVVFNSNFHRAAFLEALPDLVRLMPDYRPGWVSEAIRERSSVIYPGCRFPARRGKRPFQSLDEPPLLIWNHRWEFDKDPDTFFQTIDRLADYGLDFRLAVLGERFGNIPECFSTALARHGKRIDHYGYVPSRKDYLAWLDKGTVVVSTAIQENFGMAVVEAVQSGCLPILPDRLSYPELIPEEYHSTCLYKDPEELVQKLVSVIRDPGCFDSVRDRLAASMERFSWDFLIESFDRLFQELQEEGLRRGRRSS